MKLVPIKVIAAAAVLGLFIGQAEANTYNFSYTFSDFQCPVCNGDKVEGSFTATPNGPNDVIDISNVSAQLLDATNNVLHTSPALFVWTFLGPANQGNFQLGNAGAVASFDGLDNNFIFSETDSPTNFLDNFFYVIQPWISNSSSIATSGRFGGPLIDSFNAQYVSANWHLTEATSEAAPLPSTWLMFLTGFLGLGVFACRGTKKVSLTLA